MSSDLLSETEGAFGFSTQRPHLEEIVIVPEAGSATGISSLPSLMTSWLDEPMANLTDPGLSLERTPSPWKNIPGGTSGATDGDVASISNTVESINQLWSMFSDFSSDEAISFLLSRRYGIVLAVQHAQANKLNHRPYWLEWLEQTMPTTQPRVLLCSRCAQLSPIASLESHTAACCETGSAQAACSPTSC